MTQLIPNKETIDKIRTRAGIDEQRLQGAVKTLKDWLKKQPHLPHDYDEVRLETLLLRCKGRVEICKQTIDMYYTLTSAIPEIFCHRDPYEPWFKQASSLRCFVPLPKLTEDYDRVSLLVYLDKDPSKYIVYDVFKMIFMIFEIRNTEDYNLSEIFIVDLENITMGHVVKYTLPAVKKLQISALKGFKGRVKGIHFINAPPFVDSAVTVIKNTLKPKFVARMEATCPSETSVYFNIHVHRKGCNSLLKHVSPRILPTEYGGDAGPLHDHWNMWKEKLESYRSWFLEQEDVKVDELKRPGKSFNSNDLFGFEGSFRQLDFD